MDDVHELIDWSSIEGLLARLHSSPRGEKYWPPLMMFKALLLQSGYALSDPALEKQLARDLLFRRFIGLSISESVPDHSNLWRFRQLLEKQKHLRIQSSYPIMPVGVCNPDRNVKDGVVNPVPLGTLTFNI